MIDLPHRCRRSATINTRNLRNGFDPFLGNCEDPCVPTFSCLAAGWSAWRTTTPPGLRPAPGSLSRGPRTRKTRRRGAPRRAHPPPPPPCLWSVFGHAGSAGRSASAPSSLNVPIGPAEPIGMPVGRCWCLAMGNIRVPCDAFNPFPGEREKQHVPSIYPTARRVGGRLARERCQRLGQVDPAFVEGPSDDRPVDASGGQVAQVVHRRDAARGHQLGSRCPEADRFE